MNTTYDGILGPYLLNYDVFNDVCKAILVNLLSLAQAIILTPVPLNNATFRPKERCCVTVKSSIKARYL